MGNPRGNRANQLQNGLPALSRAWVLVRAFAWVFAWTLAWVLACPSHSVAGTADVSAPCDPGSPETSQNAPSGTGGLRFCSEVKPDLLSSLRTQLEGKIEKFYEGCDINPGLAAAPPSTGSCGGSPVPRPVCNPVAGTFNPAETTSNHKSESCGAYAGFATSRIHLRDEVDPASPFSPPRPVYRCQITPNHAGANHVREESYLRGAWIRALTCSHSQVRKEIDTRGSLSLSRVAGVPGPCANLAPYLGTATTTVQQIFDGLKSDLGGEANLKDIDSCKQSMSTDPLAGDPGNIRQSACLLASARTVLETMFTQVAACEIFYRAQIKYNAFTTAASSLRNIDVSACAVSLIDKTDKCDGAFIQNNCYVPEFQSRLSSLMDSLWPPGDCS